MLVRAAALPRGGARRTRQSLTWRTSALGGISSVRTYRPDAVTVWSIMRSRKRTFSNARSVKHSVPSGHPTASRPRLRDGPFWTHLGWRGMGGQRMPGGSGNGIVLDVGCSALGSPPSAPTCDRRRIPSEPDQASSAPKPRTARDSLNPHAAVCALFAAVEKGKRSILSNYDWETPVSTRAFSGHVTTSEPRG